MKYLFKAGHLKKNYGTDFLLGPLDIAVQPGEVLALLGPNGAGKTTCLRMIAGLLKGENVKLELPDCAEHYRRCIGYMSEELSFWPELSCRDQIEFVAGLYGCDTDASFKLCARLGLSKFLHMRGRCLSQGNQRKLSLVLSTVHDPSLLILDEPFNGLDATGRHEAGRWIREWAHSGGTQYQKSVLISSHQLEEIQNCADRVLIMGNGQMKKEFFPGESSMGLSEAYHQLFDNGVPDGDGEIIL